ncbi:ubiquinol oxidase 2, mitochondrial-like [Dioscorea cayenensis subsp. rotundata]|uniref:Ubiquinol oxidase n=1 Tax=Dioscorea cayennensis subsp. rotundata TaxID=55577 RepID=A0AB40B1U6_DIOCR|nr:ubiquinol oxidase 2, mitochondrial-like [Dioscorea cayenensis subsp. rotundata]
MAMMGSRSAGSLLRQLGPRLFSTAVISRAAAEPSQALLYGSSIFATPARAPTTWVKLLSVRMASSSTPAQEEVGQQEEPATTPGDERKEVVSYWGMAPLKLMKEDGTEWKWNCFRPWDTYSSDQTIDLKKHHKPTTLLDKIAYWTVKTLRVPTDIFFQRRYGCRAMMLETVAAVPGMVGGMLLHLRSLRRFEHSGGWIRALLEEAENERMHLMTFMEVSNPRWYERALVLAVQGVFFNAYFIGYLISPKFAHRVVGYLEEEAIHSYTEFLKEIDAGRIDNVPAPAIAIDYWRLPANSKLRDVVMVVRADEAHHRDVNHYASDIHYQGLELQKTPAPLGYH